MRTKGSRNNRSRSLPGPYTYALNRLNKSRAISALDLFSAFSAFCFDDFHTIGLIFDPNRAIICGSSFQSALNYVGGKNMAVSYKKALVSTCR